MALTLIEGRAMLTEEPAAGTWPHLASLFFTLLGAPAANSVMHAALTVYVAMI